MAKVMEATRPTAVNRSGAVERMRTALQKAKVETHGRRRGQDTIDQRAQAIFDETSRLSALGKFGAS